MLKVSYKWQLCYKSVISDRDDDDVDNDDGNNDEDNDSEDNNDDIDSC